MLRIPSLLLTAAVLSSALVLTGCTATSSQPTESTPTATSATSLPSQTSSLATPLPEVLQADEASHADAVAAAEHAMELFARPNIDFAVWWSELEPLLSVAAASAYRTVDPSSIPASRVTGPGSLPNWDTALIARVSVPTDAGVYLVIVSRSEADPSWRGERFTPPEVTDHA